jgi:tripartite-type tricarboxylate transporter receptor subunit TctC
VAPSVPAKTLQELVAYAKANPGKLNFGYGLGTSPHILGELFKATTNIELANIPYKGGAQAVNDILAGQIHLNIGTPSTLVPLIQAGKLRALAVTGDRRYPDLPDVPTVAESGLAQLSLTLWMGLLAPAGVPAEVVAKLNAALNDTLQSPRMKESLAKLGFQGIPGSPQDFEKFLTSEMESWGKAVRQTGVKVE